MAVRYPGGSGITTVVNTDLESDDMTFMGTSIAGSPQQTDYSDIKAGIVGNPGVIGGVTPATSLSVAGAVGLNGAVTINESGADVDMRVEGDTDENLFYLDAGNDFVGIGTNTPGEKLQVNGNIQVDTLILENGNSISNGTGGRIEILADNVLFAMGITGGLICCSSQSYVDITASASVTIDVNIPSGAKLIGVQLRVDTALAGGELWDAEWNDGSTIQAIASSQAVAQNTKVNKFFDVNATSDITDAETDIVITKNGGGSFTAQGTIKAIAYYLAFESMGDA